MPQGRKEASEVRHGEVGGTLKRGGVVLAQIVCAVQHARQAQVAFRILKSFFARKLHFCIRKLLNQMRRRHRERGQPEQ